MRALLFSGEVIIGYGPIVVLWLVGVGMGLPFGMASAASGELIGLLILVAVLFGGIGMWGLIQLIKKLLWPGIGYSISKYRFHLITGAVGVVAAAIGFWGVNNFVSVYMAIPLIVTFHLYHVCSQYS